ncbi:nuclear transport factor 2 family protein [Enterovirga rhinocerotis]|uniref:SnoaL-like domain-containing protein n=1 Tax=Enterovirga rhinocerotis TaxID=1339210 RepID=A0A4V3DYZ2_9HYPH|nr:nuclear transport factor 2 family protein [Enterovirga rhinocerotis]TDR94509.1 hypothetical protein EV668_1796 [Enterovirga rhinocerotis]
MTLNLNRPLAIPARRHVLAAAIVSAMMPAFAAPAWSDTSATTRNETIVRQAFERWAAGENVFPLLLSPDVVWTIPGSGPVAGTYRGFTDFVEKASRPLVSRLATPIVPDVRHIWAAGDTVIVRFDGAATTTAGHPYRNQFVWIFRMGDGRVVEAEAFLDLAAYQQVVENNPVRAR